MNTRPQYVQSLEELQHSLLAMGQAVESQIQSSIDSLANLDQVLAKKIVNQDDQINAYMLDVEEKAMRLIALQQPMAGDLRLIGMATKIAVDLERIADHAVDIAKTTMRLASEGRGLVKPIVDIRQMADRAMDMLRESLRAYVDRDVQRAASLAEQDDVVDQLYSSVFMEVLSMMGSEPAVNRQLMHLVFVAHYLERVADHTTNIGEGIIYMVTSQRKDLNE